MENTKKIISLLAFVLLVSMTIAYTASYTFAEDNQGWRVRVDEINTTAKAIDLWIGEPAKPYTHTFWKRWHLGDDAQMNVPDDLQDHDSIWIKATTEPADTEATLFVTYGNETPYEISFKDTVEDTVTKSFLSD